MDRIIINKKGSVNSLPFYKLKDIFNYDLEN